MRDYVRRHHEIINLLTRRTITVAGKVRMILAKEVRDMEELAGLNRRYAHLHTPKRLTNPDHLNRVIPATAAPRRPGLPISARYSAGRTRAR